MIVHDAQASLRAEAERVGATWTAADLLRAELDVLVPAATGGLLTAESAASCPTPLIVGPANNQLADDDVAALLHRRGIAWVPDVLASAGGIIHAVGREELTLDEAATNARIDATGVTVARLLDHARTHNVSTLQAAREFAGYSDPARTP